MTTEATTTSATDASAERADLSLICVGGTLPESGLAGRISTVAVAVHEIGACAARLLGEMRTGERAIDNDERIDFPVTLLPGETMAAAPGSGVEAANVSSRRIEKEADFTQ